MLVVPNNALFFSEILREQLWHSIFHFPEKMQLSVSNPIVGLGRTLSGDRERVSGVVGLQWDPKLCVPKGRGSRRASQKEISALLWGSGMTMGADKYMYKKSRARPSLWERQSLANFEGHQESFVLTTCCAPTTNASNFHLSILVLSIAIFKNANHPGASTQ